MVQSKEIKISSRLDIGVSVKDSIDNSIHDSLHGPGSVKIRINVDELIRGSVWNLIYSGVSDSVKNTIWNPISDEVWYRVRTLNLNSRWI
jgi:hypothetical protein